MSRVLRSLALVAAALALAVCSAVWAAFAGDRQFNDPDLLDRLLRGVEFNP